MTKIQLQAEVMEHAGHGDLEGVEEQVTEEMKEALERNGFIQSTIEMVTGAVMAVLKGEVLEGQMPTHTVACFKLARRPRGTSAGTSNKLPRRSRLRVPAQWPQSAARCSATSLPSTSILLLHRRDKNHHSSSI